MLDVLKRQKHRFLYYFLVLGLLISVIVLATVFRNDGIAVAAVVALLIYLYVFINAFDHYLKCGGCLRLITKAQMSDTLDDLPEVDLPKGHISAEQVEMQLSMEEVAEGGEQA